MSLLIHSETDSEKAARSTAHLPVCTYMVISSWPKSGSATIWETDLDSSLTKHQAVKLICDGQYEHVQRVMFAAEATRTRGAVFKDQSLNIAQSLAAEIVARSTTNEVISKAAIDFCELHGVSVPSYLKREMETI